MVVKKRLTTEEFQRAVSMMRRSMTPTNVAIAKAALVDGIKQTDLAKESGQTVQGISQMVSRVWKSHIEHGLLPDGWEQFEVCLPHELVPVVKRMESDARERLNLGDKSS